MATEWDAPRILREVRRRAAAEGIPASARHIALVCHDLFGAAGVGVQLITGDGTPEPVYATTEVVERLIELEVTLGEGPTPLAVAGGRPVLVDDVARYRTRWPMFTDAAAPERIRAVVAVPMRLGRTTIGTLEIYSARRQRLTDAGLDLVLVFAELLADQVVTQLNETRADVAEEFGTESFHLRWQAVRRATAITAIHLRCGSPEALLRLRAHAFATGRRLCVVGDDVVAGRIDPAELADRT